MIYSVTCHVSNEIANEWLEWIREHIPQVLATGYFVNAKLTRVMTQVDEGATTFSIQYRARDKDAFKEYQEKHAPALKQDGIKRWGERVLYFRTELEMIDEYRVNFNDAATNLN